MVSQPEKRSCGALVITAVCLDAKKQVFSTKKKQQHVNEIEILILIDWTALNNSLVLPSITLYWCFCQVSSTESLLTGQVAYLVYTWVTGPSIRTSHNLLASVLHAAKQMHCV